MKHFLVSSWLVSKEHVEVLVTAAMALKVVGQEQFDDSCQALYEANVDSLRAQYDDADALIWWKPDGLEGWRRRPVEDLLYVLKQARCWWYQAGDVDEALHFGAFEIDRLLEEAIRVKLHARTVGDLSDSARYDDLCWGVEVDEAGKLLLTSKEWHDYLERERAKEAS